MLMYFFKLRFHTALLTNAWLVILRLLVDCHITDVPCYKSYHTLNNTSMAFMPSLDFNMEPGH